MELCKEYKSLNSAIEKEALCESFELDFQENLPQYLDDIERVVKCSVKSVATDYECTGGAIKLYGKSIISLTYVNSSGCLLSNIFEEEFSRAISSNAGIDVKFAKINLVTKYSSFRLINQRRIDIHTAVRANITAFSANSCQCLSDCKNAFVKQYNPNRLVEKDSGICNEEFDETFTISNNNSQIRNIVNTFANCVVEDKKIIKDKMLVKLRIDASVLYENEEGAVEKCIHSFSVSKIIDVNDSGNDDNAFVKATVSSIYVKAKADVSNRLCDIEMVGRVTFNYSLFTTIKDEFVVDTYIPNYDTDVITDSVNLKSNPIYFYDDKTAELNFDVEKDIIEILDLKLDIIDCNIENSKMSISIKLSFLYYDDSSQLCYFEGSSDYVLVLNDNEMSGIGSANLFSFDYVIKNANTISLRLNFEYSAYLFKQENLNYITDISSATEKENADLPQLTLYFANKNEDVWEIAKKFSTDMSLIMDENDLTSQIIDCQRVLLVPGM